MKAFGYPAGEPVNDEGLVELNEVSFLASPQSLRRIAAFLVKQADEFEAGRYRGDHAHAQDEDRPWPEEWPDIIVVRSPEA